MVKLRAVCVAGLLALAGLPLLSMVRPGSDDFGRLPRMESHDGVLRATLVAARGVVTIDGARIDALMFNGVYGGPVLAMRAGERLELHLVNHTSVAVNIHFHGTYASPLDHGDNMYVEVPPGGAWDYRLLVPKDQPPGLYWYHVHVHGHAEDDIARGLSGAMIVLGAEWPELRTRLLVLKTYTVPDEDTAAPERLHGIVQSINGLAHSEIAGVAGATELWRISNESPNEVFHLSMPGAGFGVVGMDGAPTNRVLTEDVLEVPPAGTMDVLVRLPAAGRYTLLAGSTPTGVGRELRRDRELAGITLSGKGVPAAGPIAGAMPPARADLRDAGISFRRTIVFTERADDNVYLMDGKSFDHRRVDIRVPLGSIEEWTIRNDTDDLHVFHIHQVHFQVVAINGVAQPFDGVANVVRVPERGSVTVRMAFTDPQIVGRFMYHCHVLKHEDAGMMATIEVYVPGAAAPAVRGFCFGH